MDEYLLTVGIGVLILALLLLITNAQFITGAAPSRQLVPATSVFDLGSFSSTFVKETKTYDLGSKEVSNGVLFGENKLEFHAEAPEIESALVKFRVARMNDLGPLFVKYNGDVVEKKRYAAGDYAVRVPKEMLNESSTIEMSASSSLWQFWAPNIYSLRNINLIVKSFDFSPAELNFTLGEEYTTLKQGRIEFSLEENTGRMAVVLNGKEIMNDFARNEQSVPFSKEEARAGENKIRIVPLQGSRFSGTAHVVVFWEK
ncbi:MAG: hypothetical protein HYW26_02800 [Candidatus Aenigmarchaeota archaeon]|nr:hypothetical protein [Candidatus Aenigmarchaeota archaeon]